MISDNAITSQQHDALNRTPFVQRLVDDLLNHGIDPEKSFTLGLYGKWGSGKTSILNMVIEAIGKRNLPPKQKPVLVKFNPWNYATTEQLLSQFFDTLYEQLNTGRKGKMLAAVGSALKNYSSALQFAQFIPVVGQYLVLLKGLVDGTANNLTNIADKQQNIAAQKEAVIEALKKYGRKIIVIIDDIDRLNNDQIRLIFQLVNSIAGFPYLLYLLAFDRAIVSRALEKEQNCNGEAYLEKIIQVMLPVPDASRSVIERIFFEHLEKTRTATQAAIFDQSYWLAVSPYILDNIVTIRDIKRVINAFNSQFLPIGNDINFVDLLAVVTLQLYTPKAIDWIHRNQNMLLGNADIRFSVGLWKESEKKEYAETVKKELSELYPVSPNVLIDLIVTLFPWFGIHVLDKPRPYDLIQLEHMRRLCYPFYFHLYFTLALDPRDIPQQDMLASVMEMDANELRSFTKQLQTSGRITNYARKLLAFIDDVPEDRIALIFKEVLWLSHFSEEDDSPLNPFEVTLFPSCRLCAVKLLQRTNPTQHQAFLAGHIKQATFGTLPLLIVILFAIRDGEVSNLLLSEAAADDLLKLLYEKLLEISAMENWSESSQFKIVREFWEERDPKSFNRYLETHKTNDEDVARLVSSATRHSFGTDLTYQYTHPFSQEILPENEAYQAIKNLQKTQAFAQLPQSVMRNSMAFTMLHEAKQKRVNHADVMKALKKL